MKTDLRSWLMMSKARRAQDSRWRRLEQEIGTVVELNAKARGPALLFDKIKDYPAGFRLLAGAMSSAKRLSLTLGMPVGVEGLDLIRSMKDKMRGWSDELDEFPPMPVKDGAIFQNVDEGERVNLLKFPAPLWHHDDGGRYIGTGSVAIMRERRLADRTYRVMIRMTRSPRAFLSPRATMAGSLWTVIGTSESLARLRSLPDTIRCFSSPALSLCRRACPSIITSARYCTNGFPWSPGA
jgi:hypothetical protein